MPASGTLTLADSEGGDVTLAAGDAFTQADLDAGALSYAHDGSETTADAFSFTLSDGTTTLPEATFAITITPADDAPTLATNAGLTLDEGTTAPITTAQLEATDPTRTRRASPSRSPPCPPAARSRSPAARAT